MPTCTTCGKEHSSGGALCSACIMTLEYLTALFGPNVDELMRAVAANRAREAARAPLEPRRTQWDHLLADDGDDP